MINTNNVTTDINSDLEEAIKSLLQAFPDSFINKKGEFIAHKRANEYFMLNDCKTPFDIECKVLEWLSRAAYKTSPFSQEWRNRKFQEFMLAGLNAFLDTQFDYNDMNLIYTYLGNACNHEKTKEFVKRNYDLSIFN